MDEDFLNELPPTLLSEIQIGRFHKFVEDCFLFKSMGKKGQRMAASLIQLLEIRTYIQNDYIIKAGSLPGDSFFVLDGETMMVGLNDTKIGILRTGGFFSDEVDEKTINRRLVHIIAK